MQRSHRSRQERGVALVEFALVAVLLFTLIFGIIGYGYMMSFRQAISQGAAEGARAGAVMPATALESEKLDAAESAVNEALESYDVSCNATTEVLTRQGQNAGTCAVTIDDCDNLPATTQECVSVAVDYHYRDASLIPSLPFVSETLPEHLRYTAVAEINS